MDPLLRAQHVQILYLVPYSKLIIRIPRSTVHRCSTSAVRHPIASPCCMYRIRIQDAWFRSTSSGHRLRVPVGVAAMLSWHSSCLVGTAESVSAHVVRTRSVYCCTMLQHEHATQCNPPAPAMITSLSPPPADESESLSQRPASLGDVLSPSTAFAAYIPASKRPPLPLPTCLLPPLQHTVTQRASRRTPLTTTTSRHGTAQCD